MKPAIPDLLKPLLDRPVAVFGDGESGSGVRALLGGIGIGCAVYDARGVEFTPAAAARHGLAVFSPGFPPDHPWIGWARAAGGTALGEVDFASLFWRGRVVAVTGTNGKTTLVEFLVHALRAAGFDARAAGNIGRSFSGLAAEPGCSADTIAVCEVSSFQAETLAHFRAEAALWTNFAEDHLERHGSMGAYFRAKCPVAARAASLFAGTSVGVWVKESAPGFLASVGKPGSETPWIDTADLPADPGLAGTVFAEYPQRENFILAAAWWRAAGYDAAVLYRAARSFRLGRHRLARVAEAGGVAYWNDSKATNFHAVEGALRRFPSPVLLIAGGKSKGGDIAGFARRIAPRVKRAYLIGETGGALGASLSAAGAPHEFSGTLEAAVRDASAAAVAGDNILLSPGFASFDQFLGYADRGDRFERLVRVLHPVASVPPGSPHTVQLN
jgi:UDP-N-acetylmuramoylalanine--D-glutamate ligase